MASPSSPLHSEDAGAGAAVCCMCGDHGLARELFRCKSCRVRMQHSYCSDLYPRATAYRRCNWCLRDPAAQGGAGAAGHVAAAVANGNNKPAAETKRKSAAAFDEERHLQRHRHEGGCSSSSSSSSRKPPSGLGYPPVKKKRKAHDERVPLDARVKAGSCCNAGERDNNKEMMRAGKVRVRVQRYKLLAEVISC